MATKPLDAIRIGFNDIDGALTEAEDVLVRAQYQIEQQYVKTALPTVPSAPLCAPVRPCVSCFSGAQN